MVSCFRINYKVQRRKIQSISDKDNPKWLNTTRSGTIKQYRVDQSDRSSAAIKFAGKQNRGNNGGGGDVSNNGRVIVYGVLDKVCGGRYLGFI